MSATKKQQEFNEDGTLRRKYEIDDMPESRAGLRGAIGLVLANGLVLLKTVLFGSEAPASQLPASARYGEAGQSVGDGEIALAALSPQDDRAAPQDEEDHLAKGSGTSAHLLGGRPAFVPEDMPDVVPRGASALPAPSNDNEALYGAQPGAAINLSGVVSGKAGSSTGSGGSGGDSASAPGGPSKPMPPGHENNHDDNEDDDAGPPPRTNRLPVITAPVILADLISNQSVILALADLLRHASDPDGDALIVQNLTASSGALSRRTDGSWMFTPEPDDTSDVTFSYVISDGTATVAQTAFMDLVPPERSVIVGTPGDDTLLGTPQDDVIDGGDGNDLIIGREGNDTIYGGAGDDRIIGGDGDDVIYAGDGDDIVFAGAGNDVVFGGAGDDIIFGEEGDDALFGEDGNDILNGGAGNDLLVGGAGNDTLNGDGGDDILDGGEGDDIIDGGAGNDTIIGGTGNDIAYGGSGDDVFVAFAGDGDDHYDGGEGTDTYDASSTSADLVIDLTAGTAVSDDVGTDTLKDIEKVIGGSGNDVIVSNEAPNVLVGGPGHDVFVFPSSLAAGKGRNRDKILDFEVGDRIDLDDISDEFEDAFDATFVDHGIRRFVLISHQEEFSKPGELKFKYDYDPETNRPVTILQGNIDYDAEAEFEIEIAGHYELKDRDFYGQA
ncbi:calcium-binding protein [Leptospira interrogans]